MTDKFTPRPWTSPNVTAAPPPLDFQVGDRVLVDGRTGTIFSRVGRDYDNARSLVTLDEPIEFDGLNRIYRIAVLAREMVRVS